MTKWGTDKWGSFRWGYGVDAASDDALLRAVVSGYATWLPPPDMGAPNGGDPLTGTAITRNAVIHIYLVDEDPLDSSWSIVTEFLGVTAGSRTSQLSGPMQQDQLQFTLYDPTGYYTDGEGSRMLYDGNLVKVTMDISSPGGSITVGLGVYRLLGFPEVKRSRSGVEITVNGAEWFRNLLGNPWKLRPFSVSLPAWAPTGEPGEGGGPAEFGPPPWPVDMFNLVDSLSKGADGDTEFNTWASTWFKYQVTVDYNNGFGPVPIWKFSPFTLAAYAIWSMLLGPLLTSLTFAANHMRVDFSAYDPTNGFFNGTPDLNTTLGPDFLIRTPEWREILAELTNYNPFVAVMDGDGNIVIRNPGQRYISRYVVSCDTSGGSIALPVETFDHIVNQPDYTMVDTYTQQNPTVTTSGRVISPGSFGLRSRQVVPDRFRHNYERRQVIIWDTVTPPPVSEGGNRAPGPDFVGLPRWIDDGTAKPRILEIMQSADQVTLTLDSAFPYIMLGDELRVDMPGCRGFYNVISVTQPFDTSAMNIVAAWRADLNG